MSHQKVAIVTGASSGIGMETALALAARGYAVLPAARRAEKLARVAQRCRDAHPDARAEPVPTDVTSESDVNDLVAAAVEKFGRVDVMVNNAGAGQFARVHEIADADLRALFDVNFFGVFCGCKAVAPLMIRQQTGHIFNVSSVIGKRGVPFHGAYCSTKFAVCGLTDSLRVEMKPYGVRVTLVCPGLTVSEFYNQPALSVRPTSRYAAEDKRMPADIVARKIAATVGKCRPELVFTRGGRFLTRLSALWPSAADRLMKAYHDDLARQMRPGSAADACSE